MSDDQDTPFDFNNRYACLQRADWHANRAEVLWAEGGAVASVEASLAVFYVLRANAG